MAAEKIGRITQVIGAVLDIRFQAGELPLINEAIRIKREDGGVLPVVSVKTASDIPKGKIKDVMEAIRQIHAVAPVQIGDVLLRDAAGTGADIVATKNIPVATGFREN